MSESLPRPVSVTEGLLDALVRGGPVFTPVAVVTAHPDDETIGLGGVMARLMDLSLILVTDGAAASPPQGGEAGRGLYREARRGELDAALSALGARPTRRVAYDAPDQAVVEHLTTVTERLAADLMSVEAVLTHPREGGHPDHDACAFAAQAACALLEARGCRAPERFEFTSYHQRFGRLRTGRFIADPACREIEVRLGEEARRRKANAFGCHRSQDANLRYFAIDVERFRSAPTYRFLEPPLGEPRFDHDAWRAAAAEAAARLGLTGAL